MLGKYRRFHSGPMPTPSSSSPAAKITPPTYPRNLVDIRSALHWVHRASAYRLPEELLTVILHHANYDCLHFAANADRHDERTSYGPEARAVPYVETKPLKFLKDGEHPEWTGRVKRITLKAKSKDQGWVSDPKSGSWSWLEVGRTKLAHVVALEGGGDKVRRGPEWARNPVAKKEWTVHERTFDVDEVGGEMKTWMESLENGHRVSIVPMARYSGWQCCLTEGSVDVEVEVWK